MKESSIMPSLLLVAFIVLKLCGVIAWSWWWVFSPLWIPAVIAVSIIGAWLMFNGNLPGRKKKSRWQEKLDDFDRQKGRYKDGK